MTLNLDVPRRLPVDHLSHSSITTYLGCSERWRRRYLEMEFEPSTSNMTVGKVVGRAVTAGYLDKIESHTVNHELLGDTFDTEWTQTVNEEQIDWDGEEPGVVKDSAIESLHTYAFTLMGGVDPVTVEEGFELRLPEAEWGVEGYLDVVTASPIIDVKTSARRKNQVDLDTDTQATMYVAAKQAQEGLLRPFKWHAIKRPSPGGRSPATAEELVTTRSQLQVNNYLEKIALVAREIDWRVDTGNWQGAAPGYWKCSQKGCGFFLSCPFGGQR